MPRLYFDGGMIVGEAGHLLDLSRLKGVHIGMKSGILAADTLFENFKRGHSFAASDLKSYQDAFLESRSGKDLRRARNFHQALSRGIPRSFFHLAAQQLTAGRGWIDPMTTRPDREHLKTVAERHGRSDAPIPRVSNLAHSVEKLTSVFHSGTLHEENQIPHLKIQDFNLCYDACVTEYRYPCNRFCPASVYEMIEEGGKQKLQLNFTNCVHCQTCDIKCPKNNITWTPPEGGGGPRYSVQ
jgi:electron-transferring-flavoprotein dehydrogenase